MDLQWRWWTFSELPPDRLYAILRARHRVFGIEQDCLFEDMDGLDAPALHLTVERRNELVGYLRFLPAALDSSATSASVHPGCASFGRVFTRAEHRRQGLGRNLVAEAIRKYRAEHASAPLVIGAQLYLERFYASLGFVREGVPYDEDGITHVDMRYRPGGPEPISVT